MADVFLTCGPAKALTRSGVLPVMSAYPTVSEKLTSSGTSTAATISAGGGDIASILSSGGGIWVCFGVSPIATVAGNDCHYVSDGERATFGPVTEGHTMAVIDDA